MHPLTSAAFLFLFASILFCAAALHAGSKAHKPRFAQSVGDVKVVVPKKVTHDGKFVSHSLPHEYKRSNYAQRKISAEDKVHYHVPIDDEVHHVELWPNHEIVSPGMIVETRKGDEDVAFRKGTDVSCHYQGTVRGHGGRRSAVSTCEGLTGVLRTRRGSYIIEPSVHHASVTGVQHPHFVYRVDEEDEPNCGTSDDSVHALAKRALREGVRSVRSPAPGGNATKPRDGIGAGRLYLETLLVLDRTLIEFHGVTDVENYALTVVNMAYTLYHEDSLDVRVTPTVVRIVRLEDDEKEMNTKISPNARTTLDHFCAWQQKMNPGDDRHPNHHDVALLITRVDICSDEANCGLLGLARMAGACEPSAACALAQDNGLKLGYVVAHELAHTLGVDHDVKAGDAGCDGRLADGFTTVMNPAISMKTEEWTKCSTEDMRAFLLSGFGKCLRDEPADHAFNIQDMLPGVMYGGDYQCRSLVSQQAAECAMGLTCDSLNCEVPGYGCMETHVMPAPGTSCGEKKWCYQRRCLELGERPGAVDGGWGAWGDWSSCSRSCGSGVAVAERECDNPTPSRLGKFCVGERKRHRVCATQPCEAGSVPFRDAQCAEFNDWVYPEDGRTHNWTAHYMHDEDPCALFCKNERDSVAVLRPQVVDGTSCVRGHRDLCIGGTCREVPCDLNLESHAVEDACGICHGDGTECVVKDGTRAFDADPAAGLKKLVDVPLGARNVRVDEREPTHALIVVRGEQREEPYVKGDKLGMFEVPGSSAWLGMTHLRQESLHIPGPTTAPLTILVRPVEAVTLTYSMALRRDAARRCVGGCYAWDFVEWSACSARCGPGDEVAVPRCVERQGGLVEDIYCKHLDRPDEKNRPCFMQPCLARWMVGDWQKDCADCAPGDASCVRARSVVCMKPTGEGEGETDLVADQLCPSGKPRDVELCPMATTGSHVASRQAAAAVAPASLVAILRQTKQDTVTDFLFDPDAVRCVLAAGRKRDDDDGDDGDDDKHFGGSTAASSKGFGSCDNAGRDGGDDGDEDRACGHEGDEEDDDDDDDVEEEDDDDDDDCLPCVHGPVQTDTSTKQCDRAKAGTHPRRDKRACAVTTPKTCRAKINRGQTVVDSMDVADFHVCFSDGRDGNARNASVPACLSGVEALQLLGRLQAADRRERARERDERGKRDKRDADADADAVRKQRQELKLEEDRLEQEIADEPQLGRAFYKRAAGDEHQVSLLDIELDSEREDDLKQIEAFDERPVDRSADPAAGLDGFLGTELLGDVTLDNLNVEGLGVGELGTQAIVAAVLEDTDKHNRGDFTDMLTPTPSRKEGVAPTAPKTGRPATVDAVVAAQMQASRSGAPAQQASSGTPLLPSPPRPAEARVDEAEAPYSAHKPAPNAANSRLILDGIQRPLDPFVPGNSNVFGVARPVPAGPWPPQAKPGYQEGVQMKQSIPRFGPSALDSGLDARTASQDARTMAAGVGMLPKVHGKPLDRLLTSDGSFAASGDAQRVANNARHGCFEQGLVRLPTGNQARYAPTRNAYQQVKQAPSPERGGVQEPLGGQGYEHQPHESRHELLAPLSREPNANVRPNDPLVEALRGYQGTRAGCIADQLQLQRSAHVQSAQGLPRAVPARAELGGTQSFQRPLVGGVDLDARSDLRPSYDSADETSSDMQHAQTKVLLDEIYNDLSPLLQRDFSVAEGVGGVDRPDYQEWTSLHQELAKPKSFTWGHARPQDAAYKRPAPKLADRIVDAKPKMSWPLAARYPRPGGGAKAAVKHSKMQPAGRPTYPLAGAYTVPSSAIDPQVDRVLGARYPVRGNQPIVLEAFPVVRNSGEEGMDLARKYDFRPSHPKQSLFSGPRKAFKPAVPEQTVHLEALSSPREEHRDQPQANRELKYQPAEVHSSGKHFENNNNEPVGHALQPETEQEFWLSRQPAEQYLKPEDHSESGQRLGGEQSHAWNQQLTEKSLKSAGNQKLAQDAQALKPEAHSESGQRPGGEQSQASYQQLTEKSLKSAGNQKLTQDAQALKPDAQHVGSNPDPLHKPGNPGKTMAEQSPMPDAREEFRKEFREEIAKQSLIPSRGQDIKQVLTGKSSEPEAKNGDGQDEVRNTLKEGVKQKLQQETLVKPSSDFLENKLKEEIQEHLRQEAMAEQKSNDNSRKPDIRQEIYKSDHALQTDYKEELWQELMDQQLKSQTKQELRQELESQSLRPDPKPDPGVERPVPLGLDEPYRGYEDISEKALKRMQGHMSRMNKQQRAAKELEKTEDQREGSLYFGDLPQRELDIIEAMGAIHRDHAEPSRLSSSELGIDEQLHELLGANVDVDADRRSWEDVAVFEGREQPPGLKFIEKRDSGSDSGHSQQSSALSGEETDVIMEDAESRLQDDYDASSHVGDISQIDSNYQQDNPDAKGSRQEGPDPSGDRQEQLTVPGEDRPSGLEPRYLTGERRRKRRHCEDRPHRVHAHVRKGETVSDSEEPGNVHLTFVDDSEDDLRAGKVVPTTHVDGKEALKLMDDMQKRARTKAPAQAKGALGGR